MRTVRAEEIENAVAAAAVDANIRLPADIRQALCSALERESFPRARAILEILLENADLAEREGLALCQDTGLAVVDILLGQEVHVKGSLEQAVNEGIRRGYAQGCFRASVVGHPLERVNTGDNTPCVIHTRVVLGDGLQLTVFPKGAGSENMGRTAMLKPGEGAAGVVEFVVQAVKSAGGNPCPPLVIGVGVGGNMEYCAYMAKKALMRPLGSAGPMPGLERMILDEVNRSGIGPQGLGGNTTALGVNVEIFPTHIASLPVAVNLGCHSTRRAVIFL